MAPTSKPSGGQKSGLIPPPAAGKRGSDFRDEMLRKLRAKDPHGLLPRQRRFVEEMLIDGNQTRSARAAGYSWKSAKEQGSLLMDNARVVAAVEDGRHAILQDLRLSQRLVHDELEVLSHSNIDNYEVDAEGRLVLAPGAPAHAMRAVASFKFRRKTFVDEKSQTTVTEDHEYRLWDKNTALAKRAQVLGMVTENVRVGDPDGKPLAPAGAMTLETLRAIVKAAKAEG